jgi:hypothetical protein
MLKSVARATSVVVTQPVESLNLIIRRILRECTESSCKDS